MAKHKPIEEEEVDVTCDNCDGEGSVEDGWGERSCTRCGGTGLMTVIRPPSTSSDYHCGTFDQRGRCVNCDKKISDLNDGKGLCPFGKYPSRSTGDKLP